VVLDDGRRVQVVFKELSPHEVSQRTRQAKPEFLYDPLREIDVYRRILSTAAGADLGAPRLYASIADAEQQRFGLFLERVRGVALNETGDFALWDCAARWLALLHSRFVGRTGNIIGNGHRLIAHTRDAHLRWIDRAARFVRLRGGVSSQAMRCIDRLAVRYDVVSEQLLSLPQTLLHGECFASNVLVAPGGELHAGRIHPVDWELAAVGPGVMDLAALTAGKWSDAERERFADAYWVKSRELTGAELPPAGQLHRALAVARLHLAVQMVGWSQQWTPPPQHAHDWLAEVERLANQLELA
jgi:hypothetical protein